MATHIFKKEGEKLLYNGTVVLGIIKMTYNSSTYSVTIANAYDVKDVLVRSAKVSDISVNNETFSSYEELSVVLTPLLFINGGKGGSESGSKKIEELINEVKTAITDLTIKLNIEAQDPLITYTQATN